MTLDIDFYFSFRSPYSYLAIQQVEAISRRFDVTFKMRIVRPIALRIPGFFKQLNPLQPPYLMRDTARIAERLGIPYRWPQPDPVVMNFATGEVDEEQPYIDHMNRLGVAAEKRGRGLTFALHASRAIWSGNIDNWHQGSVMAEAAEAAGLEMSLLERDVASHPSLYDDEIAQNETEQLKAGHWGVPLFVFNDEPFFGQDRLVDLLWCLERRGLKSRQ